MLLRKSSNKLFKLFLTSRGGYRLGSYITHPRKFGPFSVVVAVREQESFPLSNGLTGSGFYDEFLICGENRFNRTTSRRGKIAGKTNRMHLLVGNCCLVLKIDGSGCAACNLPTAIIVTVDKFDEILHVVERMSS